MQSGKLLHTSSFGATCSAVSTPLPAPEQRTACNHLRKVPQTYVRKPVSQKPHREAKLTPEDSGCIMGLVLTMPKPAVTQGTRKS